MRFTQSPHSFLEQPGCWLPTNTILIYDMRRTFGFLGVPSSAGAHYPGQEKTPAVLRQAGLAACLRQVGIGVTDYGDLPRVFCRVEPKTSQVDRLTDVRTVSDRVADCVDQVLSARQTPLVVGGDCTITIGIVSGFIRSQPDLALLYLDGGLDAGTLESYRLGRLDSTVLAHLLAEPGSEAMLSEIGPRYPLMSGRNVVPFGYALGEPLAVEQDFLARHDIRGYPVSVVSERAAQAAMEARSHLESIAERFLIHFDIDVIDYTDFPVADVLQPKQGMTFADTFVALGTFCASTKFGGLVITEFNPDHDNKDKTLAKQLIAALARVL
jgi:arginase